MDDVSLPFRSVFRAPPSFLDMLCQPMLYRIASPLFIAFFSISNAPTDSDRIAEYDMKLMDIDSDTLGIPDTDYDARVTMPSSEFTRIVRDLSQLGESVRIEVNKEGVRFASDGEAANGSVLLKQTESARELYKDYGVKEEKDDDDDEEEEDEAKEDEEVEAGSKKTKKKKAKKEKVKEEKGEDVDMDEEEKGEEEFKPKSDDEGEDEQDDDDDDDDESGKKRKKSSKVCFLFLFYLLGHSLLFPTHPMLPSSPPTPLLTYFSKPPVLIVQRSYHRLTLIFFTICPPPVHPLLFP